MKRTLIVAAHLDDETFGMGGTLIDLCQNNPKDVKIVVLCQGRNDFDSEMRLSAFSEIQKELGFKATVYTYNDLELEMVPLNELTKLLEVEINDFKPDRVFTVSEQDIHQDHKIVSHATKIVCRPNRSTVTELYEFSIPGSEPFTSSYFDTIYNVTKYVKTKTEMCALYKTEKQPQITPEERFRTIYRILEI